MFLRGQKIKNFKPSYIGPRTSIKHEHDRRESPPEAKDEHLRHESLEATDISQSIRCQLKISGTKLYKAHTS